MHGAAGRSLSLPQLRLFHACCLYAGPRRLHRSALPDVRGSAVRDPMCATAPTGAARARRLLPCPSPCHRSSSASTMRLTMPTSPKAATSRRPGTMPRKRPAIPPRPHVPVATNHCRAQVPRQTNAPSWDALLSPARVVSIATRDTATTASTTPSCVPGRRPDVRTDIVLTAAPGCGMTCPTTRCRRHRPAAMATAIITTATRYAGRRASARLLRLAPTEEPTMLHATERKLYRATRQPRCHS